MAVITQKGFTLIELTMVMVVMGILSAVVMPRFFDTSTYQTRLIYDELLSALRYAHKLAIATNCNVLVTISGNQYSLYQPGASDRSQCQSQTTANFTSPVLQPGSSADAYTGAETGVTLSTVAVIFTAAGTANADTTISVGGSKTMQVFKNTGFAYASSP